MLIRTPQKFINNIDQFHVVNWLISEECNEDCKFCLCEPGKGHLKIAKARAVIDILSKKKINVIKFTGGEPLLYPGIWDVLAYAKSKNIETHLHTNGLLLTEEYLNSIGSYVDVLGICLDGSTQKIQTIVSRPANHFDHTINILRNRNLSGSKIAVRTLLCDSNKDDIINIGNLLCEYNITCWIIFQFRALGRGKTNRACFEISDDAYAGIQDQLDNCFKDRLKIVIISKDIAHSPYFFINSQGDVFTIHPEKEENIFLGNILEDDFNILFDHVYNAHAVLKMQI